MKNLKELNKKITEAFDDCQKKKKVKKAEVEP